MRRKGFEMGMNFIEKSLKDDSWLKGGGINELSQGVVVKTLNFLLLICVIFGWMELSEGKGACHFAVWFRVLKKSYGILFIFIFHHFAFLALIVD